MEKDESHVKQFPSVYHRFLYLQAFSFLSATWQSPPEQSVLRYYTA